MSVVAPSQPRLQFFASANIDVGEPIEIEQSVGRRRIIPITGGTVARDGWAGLIVPGGADHQTIYEPGVTDLHALYVLQLTDGTRIHVDNHGLRTGAPDVIERLNSGEYVDPGLVYFRGAVRLSTAAGNTFSWVNSRLFVGVGIRLPHSVRIDLFELEESMILRRVCYRSSQRGETGVLASTSTPVPLTPITDLPSSCGCGVTTAPSGRFTPAWRGAGTGRRSPG